MAITILNVFLFVILFSNCFVHPVKSESGSSPTHRKHAPECLDFQSHILSPSEKKYIILLHVLVRKNLLKGAYKHLPKAGYLDRLRWNESLAEMAQEWTTECKTTKDPNVLNDETLGQNIAVLEGSEKKKISIKDLVKTWLVELRVLNPDIIATYQRPKSNDRKYDSIAQVIKWDTTDFGCAVSEYKPPKCKKAYACIHNNTMVNLVCNYYPGAIKTGDYLYKTVEQTKELCDIDSAPRFCRNTSLDIPDIHMRREDDDYTYDETILDNYDYIMTKDTKTKPSTVNSAVRISNTLSQLWPGAQTSPLLHVLISFISLTFYFLLFDVNIVK